MPVLKGKKRSQNLAPVLVIISGNSLASRKIITSTGFYRCCAPGASAPVVIKNQSPSFSNDFTGPLSSKDKRHNDVDTEIGEKQIFHVGAL